MVLLVTRVFIVVTCLFFGSCLVWSQKTLKPTFPQHVRSATVTQIDALSSIVVAPTVENVPVLVRTSPILQPVPAVKSPVFTQATPPGVHLGITYYDFQTNASMPERVTYVQDGSEKYCQVLWMASKDSTRNNRQPGFNNSRGAHYNFVDVTDANNSLAIIEDWSKVESPNERSGWPSIVQFPETGQVGTPAHCSVFNGTVVKFFSNGGPGDDRFFEYSQVSSTADTALWPRAAVDGRGNIHLIYNRSMPDRTVQVVYRRSTNLGESWSPEIFFTGPTGVLPLGETGSLPNGAGGDTYAISARGNIVAVAYTDSPLRVLGRISTDYGETWNSATGLFLLEDAQHTALDSVLYNNGGVDSVRIWTDTVAAPSSQISIVIDSEGYPHYAIGQALTYIIRRKPADNSAPGSGFIYSVEDDRYYKDLGIIYQKFGDINSRTIVGLAGGGNWDGEGKIVSRRPYSGSSRYPQLGIDANDNIYMVYTSVTSGDHMQMMIDTTGANANEPDTLVSVNGLFGHLYVTHKLKDFRTWSQPKDITPMGTNCLFGTLCDSVTDYMYIAYSANTMPGDRVTSVELPTMETGVYLYPFPVASLNTISNVNEIGTATADVSLYPNPTANDVHLRMTNVTPGPITVSVFSVQGERLIYSSGHVQGDEYETSLVTRNLATGSYQVIVEQNGTIASRTLSVLR